MTDETTRNRLVVRGRSIRSDANGLVCLNDIWEAAGFRTNQRPRDWWRLPSTRNLASALLDRIVGKSPIREKIRVSSIFYAKSGTSGGSFAHPVLACSYAEYLSPKLGVEVREIWLRYRAGDAVLADDILQRASATANEWAGMRALGRAARKEYVDVLVIHEVTVPGIGMCTNAIYQGLYGTTAQGLRKKLNLPKSANPRDHFTTADLAYTMAAEMLAKEDIEETNRRGDKDCRRASKDAASAIGNAIEQNRAERRRQIELDLAINQDGVTS